MGGGQYVEAPAVSLPHGERWVGRQEVPEDHLPVPRCVECRDAIFYERGGWLHREIVMDGLHPAEPEEIA
jgi:hypothetical protein